MIEQSDNLPRATGIGRPLEENYSIAVYGDTGGGKTAWVEEILLRNKKRLYIVDTNCKDYGNAEFCRATGIKYDAIVHSPIEAARYLTKPEFRVILRSPGSELAALRPFMFDNEKRKAVVNNATICIEEIGSFMTSDKMPVELENLIIKGRHAQNSLIGIAQVPRSQTHPLYRSQMKLFISFVQTEANAIKFFSDFDIEKAERLRALQRGYYEIFRGTPEALLSFIKKQ